MLPPQPSALSSPRAQRAQRDIAEALSLMPRPPAQAPPQPGATPTPPQPSAQPSQMPNLAVQPPPQNGGMPTKRPEASPLAAMPSFKSPPLAAALQGAVGREGPVGFAAGGFVDLAVKG